MAATSREIPVDVLTTEGAEALEDTLMQKLLLLLSAKSSLDDRIHNLIFLQSHSLDFFGPAVPCSPILLRKFISCAEHLLLLKNETSSFGPLTTRKGKTSLSEEELDIFQGQVH